MKFLTNSLKHYLQKGTKNVILFILKLIYNCETIFRPYVDDWFNLIINCIFFLNEVNYFTADMVSVFPASVLSVVIFLIYKLFYCIGNHVIELAFTVCSG